MKSIKVTVLRNVEPVEVEVEQITDNIIWMSKNPYIVWEESTEYECDDLYSAIAKQLGLMVTSEWWAYDEDNDELTAKDEGQYELGEYPSGYAAYCKPVNTTACDLRSLLKIDKALDLIDWTTQVLDRLDYKEGNYNHYLFHLGSSLLFEATSGRRGDNFCPTHTSYYRWRKAHEFEPPEDI